MDMITKEMIENGLREGFVSIEDEHSGCIGLCCRIGDEAFYFAEGENLSAEDFSKNHTIDETKEMLHSILKTTESAEENGLTQEEWCYYKAILS